MKVKTWIDYSSEIEVDVSIEDINSALMGEDNRYHHICNALNNFATYIKSLDEKSISQLSNSQRKTINNFLIEQSKRF